MNTIMKLHSLLKASGRTPRQKLALFAILNLGIIESLANGLVTATQAMRFFFNAENCLFVRRQFRDKTADAIMSHGVQLPDLFEALPTEEAHREFQRELGTMRNLCLKLLDKKQLVA
jgi:hypothetical protein